MPIRLRSLLVAALLVALSACSSKDDPLGPGAGGTPNGSMSAVIDGVPWTAVQVFAQRSSCLISVGASDAEPLGLGFALFESGTGTFTIGGPEVATGNLTTTATTWTATSGQITFTTLTTERAIGTFSFGMELAVGTGAATRTVTNGVFDLTF